MYQIIKYKYIKNPEQYDDNYYYFFDLPQDEITPTVIGIPSPVLQEDIDELKEEYIMRPLYNKELFDFLFLGGKYPYKKESYNYLLLLDGEDTSLMSIFNELYPDAIIYELRKDILIIYEGDAISEAQLLTISEDTGCPVRALKGKINCDTSGFLTIYCLYTKYFTKYNYPLTTILDLVLEAIKSDYQDYKKLQKFLANDIFSDYQIEEITKAMATNDLNVSQTANEVYMHRNTIINKLAFIEQKTGLNPQKFNDAVLLYLLLKLK